MVYRIHTENKNIGEVTKIVGRYFDGFTMIKAQGYWQGKAEDSLVIEVAIVADTPPNFHARVESIVSEINTVNHQECCLVEVLQSSNYLW